MIKLSLQMSHITFLPIQQASFSCFQSNTHFFRSSPLVVCFNFFIHANYAPNRPINGPDSQTALWLPLEPPPGPHYSGKTAIVGHTPQFDGDVLNLGHLVCIDTGCGLGGILTAFEPASGRLWQVDERGRSA